MKGIEIDYETFSTGDLKKFGAFSYAAHESTEILMAGISFDGADPEIWVNPRHCPDYRETNKALMKEFNGRIRDGELLYAHNASFEHAVTRWNMEIDMGVAPPALEQWRCTRAMALRAGLPASLDQCSKALGLDELKDAKGKALIRKFSIPQKDGSRIMGYDDPEDFGLFIDYCIQDVKTEMAIREALQKFDVSGQCLKNFLLDIRMNHEGVPMNIPALHNAQAVVEEVEVDLFAKFRKLTNGLNPTQNIAVKKWMNDRGYPLDNMQAAKIEEFLKDEEAMAEMKPDALEALKIRYDLGYAAVKKIPTFIGCDCGDSRARGTLVYYGAQRTGRWTGALLQPQNLKRPSIKDTDGAYEMICEGRPRDEIEIIYGNAYEVVSSCVRHFIQAPTGDLYDADYAGIEARIVSWLADDQPALVEFFENVDKYIKMGAKIFPDLSVEEMEARKKRDEFCLGRFVGKQAVLGCGYQMGPPKFKDTCAQYGQEISDDVAEKAVRAYRKENYLITQLWKQCNEAAQKAILYPGRKFSAGKYLKFWCEEVAGIFYMFMRLPSGRKLAYPHAKIVDATKVFVQKDGSKKRTKVKQIAYWGRIQGTKWGTITSYGGKLVENATQAVAADLMGFGACEAERQGFRLITMIHDELLAYEHDTLTVEDFEDALATLPRWAKGLPLVAEGKRIPYYKK